MIIVDWSDMSLKYDYIRVAHSVNVIGREIALLIDFLNFSYKKVHCIGHSLGIIVQNTSIRHICSQK